MTKQPTVSVLMASYNHAPYIREAIRSICQQSVSDLELIIVDDGSTDNSQEIIQRYAETDPRIIAIYQENSGPSAAVNRAIQQAKGKFIALHTSDDISMPDRLEKQLEFLSAHENYDITGSYIEEIDGAGQIKSNGRYESWFNTSTDLDNPKSWVWHNSVCSPTLMLRGNFFDRYGILDPFLVYTQDWEMLIHALSQGAHIHIIPEKLLQYRGHGDNLTHKNATQTFWEYAYISSKTLHPWLIKSSRSELALQNILVFIQNPVYKELTDGARTVLADTLLRSFNGSFKDLIQRYSESRAALEVGATVIEAYGQLHNELEALHNSRSWKITQPLRRVGEFFAQLKRGAHPHGAECYRAMILVVPEKTRPRVVHVIGNFMTGGSSRLVVDLFEHLGHLYEQEVVTQYNPAPPNYTGIPVHEFRRRQTQEKFSAYLRRFQPELIHIHYWGSADKRWYAKIINAAHEFGCKVVENINTPVAPYVDSCVSRYVYVSDYVSNTFGRPDAPNLTVYPGSNFRLFTREVHQEIPDDCIGMVYRLDTDKLNERSIDVFIKVIQKRPQTKVIIVGGGSFLEPYKVKVKTHHVENAFNFTGFVPYERLPALYAQMSLFVAPVWKESFGQVSPFAMSMGIPVVGYNIGALAEILGDTSLLAPPDDSDALAEIIISLLDDRQRRLQIGQRNRERAHTLFSIESMIESYAKLYQELVGKKP